MVTTRMGTIDFSWLLSHGALLIKAECWREFLDSAKECIMEYEDFEDAGKTKAPNNMASLEPRVTAKAAGKDAYAAYRYLYEEGLRAIICFRLEVLLPNYWVGNWGRYTMHEVFKTLCDVFGGLSQSDCRLFRKFPAAVVSSFFETFVNVPESLTMFWWEDKGNVDGICKRDTFAAYPGGSPPKEREDFIRDAIELLSSEYCLSQKAPSLV